MKIEVLSERTNPLLSRKEIKFKVSFHGGTPSVKDVRKDLLGVLKSKAELTVVDTLEPGYGESALAGYVKVYADEKAMKIEPKHLIKKNFGVKEEEKKEAAPAAAPAPAPEKKEAK